MKEQISLTLCDLPPLPDIEKQSFSNNTLVASNITNLNEISQEKTKQSGSNQSKTSNDASITYSTPVVHIHAETCFSHANDVSISCISKNV